jgi:hypothetical protein
LFALVGLGIVWLVLICQPHVDPEELEDAAEPVPPSSPPESHSPRRPPPSLASPSRAVGWVAGMMLAALFVLLLLDEGSGLPLKHTGRGLLPLLLFFGVIVWEGTVDRPSDRQIIEAIQEERHFARRMALRELGLLLPAFALGVVGWLVMARGGDFSTAISDGLHTKIRVGGLAMFRDWSPLLGLATAASGYMIAGALGWTVRIVFTLVLGKEAFGTGDIHLMAAAGCIAGWPIVVLGFFLTCGLAIVGWLVSLPFKRTRALPLGPWLSLSFLTLVVFYDLIIQWPVVDRAVQMAELLFFEN